MTSGLMASALVAERSRNAAKQESRIEWTLLIMPSRYAEGGGESRVQRASERLRREVLAV